MTAAAPVEPVLSRDLPQDASPGLPPLPKAAPATRALAVLEVSERGRHLAQAVPIMRWPCTLGRAVHADAVLTDPAVERIQNSDISELVITNTIPLPAEKAIDKIKVLSVAPLLGEAIMRIFHQVSVSKLFEK